MPGVREKPLHLQSTTDLWIAIAAIPVFLSFFVALPFLATAGHSWLGPFWGPFWLALVWFGFFTVQGVFGIPPRLKELCRRGAWVPPGTARRPVLASIVLELLIIAAGVANIFAMAGVSSLAVAAGMRESFAGVLGCFFSLSLAGAAIVALRRLARKPPGPEGTTGPSPPSDRPPEQA
jgi:hypothetical protein